MKLLEDVDFSNPHPRLIEVITVADQIHHEMTAREIEVTSGRRPKKGRISFHATEGEPFRAFDARDWYLKNLEKRYEYRRQLLAQFALRRIGLQIVIEPDDLSMEEISYRGGLDKIAPHIHHELDPDELSALDWERVT